MADKNASIQALQAIVTGLTAQSVGHRMHSHVFAGRGLAKLGTKYAEHADEEMGYVEQFIDRIIDLGGTPRLEAQSEGVVFTDVEEYLKSERHISEDGIAAVAQMLEAGIFDVATYELVKTYLIDEDADLQETNEELELIELIGKKNWYARQL